MCAIIYINQAWNLNKRNCYKNTHERMSCSWPLLWAVSVWVKIKLPVSGLCPGVQVTCPGPMATGHQWPVSVISPPHSQKFPQCCFWFLLLRSWFWSWLYLAIISSGLSVFYLWPNFSLLIDDWQSITTITLSWSNRDPPLLVLDSGIVLIARNLLLGALQPCPCLCCCCPGLSILTSLAFDSPITSMKG